MSERKRSRLRELLLTVRNVVLALVVIAIGLVATSRVVQKDRSAGHAEAEVVDADGRLVARFSSTCLVMR